MGLEVDLVAFFKTSKNIQSFTRGEIIFREGDSGNCSYVLLEGKVDIQTNSQSIYTAEPGEILGIMSIVDESHRSATAIALEDCKLALLDKKEFLFLVQETPYFALDMMKMLAEWLRKMDAKV